MINNMNNEDKNTENKSYNFINILLRSAMSFVGIAVLSMGAVFLQKAGLGMDPFTAMNIGFSNSLHMPLGTFQLMMNAVLFIIIFIFDRKQIGIGTILNMVLVGYEIQWFYNIYDMFIHINLNPFVMIVDVVAGLLLFSLGTSLYMSLSLGSAPYDAIAPIISSHVNLKYKYIRSLQDIVFMVIALMGHGAVGIITIVVAFFAGPLINYWNTHISQQLVYHIKHFSTHPTAKNAGSGIVGLGKVSLMVITRAYEQTTYVKQHLSGYSDQELFDVLKHSEESLNRNEYLRKDLISRISSIKGEIKRRNLNN
ncbi:YczE/YyaS/YitT family protein [Apilactobacillus ozensis]|uniref:YczE/YyaS/YitT family protein n=1 Tax=Apilactobacillus ozensis TaxID=866801 RepID=UPI00200B55F1|nr:membrane protein [Apilactobacillus ozensis]MCK8606868.1 membrane protein [Apilactobacillus ozensis]